MDWSAFILRQTIEIAIMAGGAIVILGFVGLGMFFLYKWAGPSELTTRERRPGRWRSIDVP